MTVPSEAASPTRVRMRALGGVLVLTLLALAALGFLWWVAVPVGPEVCALTWPGPRNCFAGDRLAAARVWTVIIVLVAFVSLVATVLLSRRHRWIPGVGASLLILVGVAGFVATAWIPVLA